MAQTTVLAAGTTGANSDDIAVGTTPLTVALFSGETDQHMDRIKCSIYQKDVNDNYFPYTAQLGFHQIRNPIILTNTQRQWTFNQPGTYRVVRPACTSSVGIQTDDGT